jgi:hypothetical protein
MIAEIARQVREAEVLDGGEFRWNRGKDSPPQLHHPKHILRPFDLINEAFRS